jgi:hypothetical protein
MSIQTVLDGICRYFGGPYEPETRTYRSSPLQQFGVGVVRRGWTTDDRLADYFNGQDAGARTGCQIVVWIPRDSESRFALGGEHGGQKNVRYDVEMACYIRSRTPHAEDAQDDVYALRDALKEWMRQDRTLGDACFEAGEFVDGGQGSIDCDYGQPETKAGLTKSFLLMTYTALEIVQA